MVLGRPPEKGQSQVNFDPRAMICTGPPDDPFDVRQAYFWSVSFKTKCNIKWSTGGVIFYTGAMKALSRGSLDNTTH